MPTTDRKGRAQLQPLDAIREGWRSWIVLILVALGSLVVVLATQPLSSSASEQSGGSLAGSVLVGIAIAWLVLMGAAVLLLRSYCFQAVWDGRAVEPGSYLKGMYQVWGVLVVGGLLGTLGAILMGSVMPGVLVALVSLLALVFSRPDGRALGV